MASCRFKAESASPKTESASPKAESQASPKAESRSPKAAQTDGSLAGHSRPSQTDSASQTDSSLLTAGLPDTKGSHASEPATNSPPDSQCTNRQDNQSVAAQTETQMETQMETKTENDMESTPPAKDESAAVPDEPNQNDEPVKSEVIAEKLNGSNSQLLAPLAKEDSNGSSEAKATD
ncbi:hypothetical protein L1887_48786 [Cichorium endivia]|nr:hypothetical protein L1887_48786 [Cichorium endivia]